MSESYVKFGKLTICAVTVQGVKSYELWHDAKPDALGRFDSFSEAKDAAIREERRELNKGESE